MSQYHNIIIIIYNNHRKRKLRKQQSILDLTAPAVFKSTSLLVLFCPYHAFIIPAIKCPQMTNINENQFHTFIFKGSLASSSSGVQS